MSAHEIAAKRLQAFLNKVGRVPAIGGFGPKARQHPAVDSSFALRGAVSHAREALDALERGNTEAFLALYQAFRDFKLDAERHEADALAARAVEAERAEASARIEAQRRQAEERAEAERLQAEKRVREAEATMHELVKAEREIRMKGPRIAAALSTEASQEIDQAAWQAAQEQKLDDLFTDSGRLSVSKLAERICDACPSLGTPGSIRNRLARYAKTHNIDLEEWARTRPHVVARS